MPVFVGGTGSFTAALVKGISDIPNPPPKSANTGDKGDWKHRRAWWLKPPEVETRRRGIATVLRMYSASSGRWKSLIPQESPFISFTAKVLNGHSAGGASIEAHLVSPPRAELHARINQRFDMMMAAGALGEVEMLLKRICRTVYR
ncbi:MAG: hypothetical protein R3D29_09730 [Nitratireductor sp.]